MMLGRSAIAVLVSLACGAWAAARYEPPTAPDAQELNKAILKHVEDDAPSRSESENPDECLAYDYVVGFASRVPPASFQKAARADLTFAQLLGPEAYKYRGEVVRVEGRLKRVRDIGPTAGLEADGVKHLYEAWIFSEQYREYSYCALFTELPPGIGVGEDLDQKVSFDGYFYKVYRFRAGDGYRKAPLIVGRTMVRKSTKPALWDAPGRVVPVMVGLAAITITGLGALGWWYRQSDRRTRDAVTRARGLIDGPDAPAIFHDPSPGDGGPALD